MQESAYLFQKAGGGREEYCCCLSVLCVQQAIPFDLLEFYMCILPYSGTDILQIRNFREGFIFADAEFHEKKTFAKWQNHVQSVIFKPGKHVF